MAKMTWTPAQRTAIDYRAGTLLVSAAAGSGKTAVLTERVVELLKDPEHPIQADRLLIVTFTNAAAAELRARIAARLEQVIAEQPGNNHLRRQKMLLQRAHICTIDAFCLHLLQQHFAALDIPPDFTMADSGVVGRLKAQALAETLEEAYTNTAFCDFANLYGKGRSDGAASAAVLQVYDFLRTMPFEEKTKAMLCESWQSEQSFAQSTWCAVLLQQVQRAAQRAVPFAKDALTLCEDDCEEAKAAAYESKKTPALQQKAVKGVEEKYSKIFACLESLIDACSHAERLSRSAEDWDLLYDFVKPYRTGEQKMPGLKNIKVRLNGSNGARAKQEGDAAGELFAKICNFVPCCMQQEAEYRARALPMIESLLWAQTRFAEHFYALKIEKKVLEFSDIEHLALQLLDAPEGERTPLAQSISGAFDAVMVDEYQDTNALQEEIYRRLAHASGDNLFFVGDLKQSIYRFRQAEPSIFADKQSSFAQLSPDGQILRDGEVRTLQQGAVLNLDANFRSSPAVVDSVNFIFGAIMDKRFGGVDYVEGQRLVCQGGDAVTGRVQLLIDTEGQRDPEQVATKIKALIAAGQEGREEGLVRDGSLVRPVRYEDCCILLSTRAPFRKYAEALAACDIQSYADSAEDLLSTSHVQPLVSLLQIIDNPAQDVPLASVMLSVVFGFTEDDLVALRLRQKQGSLYGAVVKVAGEARQSAGDPFAEKILAFYESLSALRRLSHTLAPEALLAEIFASTHYLALVGAMENGARRREDVSKFVAYVANVGANGIESLVHNMEQTIASGGLVESAPGRTKAGCVTIMTIHRSKGLQFPVVFVGDMQHRFNTDSLKRKILLHRVAGLGMQLRAGEFGANYQTAASMALRQIEKEEILSEELRLLYVALTRAQDHLYMSASIRKLQEKLAKMAFGIEMNAQRILSGEAICFMDWVLLALLQHPTCAELRKELLDVSVPIEAATHAVQIEIMPEETVAAEEQNVSAGLTAQVDEALVAQLMERFDWQYPHAALTALPAKVSVTSLVHKEQGTVLARPAFLAKDGMSAAEKGTALHAFLENADFAALKQASEAGQVALHQALAQEQLRQVREEFILPEIAEKLDMDAVQRFFGGEVFAHIAAATEIYREYAFITGLPAREVLEATAAVAGEASDVQVQSVADEAAQATVLVQGIADLVLVYPDHLELLDYKSDHGKSEAGYRKAYAKQLEYYAKAIEKRFAPLKMTYKAIYSFDLGKLIAVE